MVAFTALVATCWLMVLVARPRQPLPGNEVQELVYARLLGRHQRLIVIAVVASAVAFLVLVLSLPQRVHADLQEQRVARWRCDAVAERAVFCAERSAGGMWLTKQRLEDGTWQVIGVGPVPPPFVPAADVR
jgi:hypothetical protein